MSRRKKNRIIVLDNKKVLHFLVEVKIIQAEIANDTQI